MQEFVWFPTRISGSVTSLNPFILEKATFNLFGSLKICGVRAAVNHKIDKIMYAHGFCRRVADWFEIEVRNTLRAKSIPMTSHHFWNITFLIHIDLEKETINQHLPLRNWRICYNDIFSKRRKSCAIDCVDVLWWP